MGVETIGEAYRLGWRIKVRCAFGTRDGMKSIRECKTRADLDLKTLVWTRGDAFPISRLESRLNCPDCGSRRVTVIFDVPIMRIGRGPRSRGILDPMAARPLLFRASRSQASIGGLKCFWVSHDTILSVLVAVQSLADSSSQAG